MSDDTPKQAVSSYGKIYNLGHAAVAQLLLDEVLVEEKIDGSQFSFQIVSGELLCRSHHQQLDLDAPDKMFANAVEVIREIAPLLKEGWVYRGEYLRAPKHNCLAYDRIPDKHIMIFDIDTGDQCYLNYDDKVKEASRLGLECVPCFSCSKIEGFSGVEKLLDTDSVLGGTKIEGIVIKNYVRFGRDGKTLMGKFVSEKFKEVNQRNWKKNNPSSSDIKLSIGESLRTEARWNKSIQRLAEAGQITNSPRDIGGLIKAIVQDVKEECEDDIKEALFKWAWPDLNRKAIAGFPQWYKERLAKMQFEGGEVC